MPRHNRIERRAGARVAVVIDSIEHTLTETGFFELMTGAVAVLQALTAERQPVAGRSTAPLRAGRPRAGRPAAAVSTVAPAAALRAAAGDYAGVDVAQLRTRAAADGSTRCRATFEDGGRARFTVRVPLGVVTAADIEDFESLE